MSAKLNQAIIDTLENAEFHICGDYEQQGDEFVAEVEWYSPAGEDVIITLFFDGSSESFVEAWREYANDFDADEHAAMWVSSRGKGGVPSTIKELADDAEAIEEALLAMAATLENINLA